MFASAPGRGGDRSGGGPTESKIGDLGLYFPFSLVRKGPCRTQGQCAIVPGPSAVAFLGGCLRKKKKRAVVGIADMGYRAACPWVQWPSSAQDAPVDINYTPLRVI